MRSLREPNSHPISRVLNVFLVHDHIQWHPPLIRHCTNSWFCYRIWPLYLTFLSRREQILWIPCCINVKKNWARRGAKFIPTDMPTICWKIVPAKRTKMLSTRDSGILMLSSSVYLPLGFENRVLRYIFSKCLYLRFQFLWIVVLVIFAEIWRFKMSLQFLLIL